MNFELKFPEKTTIRMAEKFYDSDLDDIRSILIDVSESIDGEAQFCFSGFGQNVWPVDVATDLVIFLEQLPAMVSSAKLGLPVVIDFYEQGMERRIDLSLTNETYVAKCTSQTEWQPNPEIEEIDRVALLEMLASLSREFLRIVGLVSPWLLAHPWLCTWANLNDGV